MNSSNSQSQQEISQDQNEDPEEQKDQIVEESPKGRFIRFNEELGFGAYKTVYKGYDNDSGCEIAWNVIKLQRLPQWLQYLHEQEPHPIIHRDIKCENIFVNTVNNEIRIGDLGLALTLKSDFTTSVLGTPEFMAPEIYEEKYGTAVDIYAFGMCLLEMATLQIPYKECTSAAQVYKKVSQGLHPNSLQLIQNDQLKQFILKCIQKYENRPSAAQLLQDDFFKESEIDNQPIQLATDRIPLSSNNPMDSPHTPHQQQNNQQNQEHQHSQVQSSAFKKNNDFESPVHQATQKQDNYQSSSSASKSSHSKKQKGSNQGSPSQSQNSSQSSEKQVQQNPISNQQALPKHGSQNSLSSTGKSQTSSNYSPLNDLESHQKKQQIIEGMTSNSQKQISQDSHQLLEQNLNHILQEDKYIKIKQGQSQEIPADQLNLIHLKQQKQYSKESLSSQNSQMEISKESKTVSQDIEDKNLQNASHLAELEVPFKIDSANDKVNIDKAQQQQTEEQNNQDNLNIQQDQKQQIKIDVLPVDQNQGRTNNEEEEEHFNQKYYLNKNIIYTNNSGIVTQFLPPTEKRVDDDYKMRKITEDSKDIQDEDRQNEDFSKRKFTNDQHTLSNQFKNTPENISFSTLNVSHKKELQNDDFSFDKINKEQFGDRKNEDLLQQQQINRQSFSQKEQIILVEGDHTAASEERNENQHINLTHSPISLPRKSDASNATPIMNNNINIPKTPSSDEKSRFFRQKSQSGEDFYNGRLYELQKEDIQVAYSDNNSVAGMHVSNPEYNQQNHVFSPQTIKDSVYFHDQQYDQLLRREHEIANNQKNEIANSMHNLNQYGGNDHSDYASNQESGISLDKYSNRSQDNLNQVINPDQNKRSPSNGTGSQEEQNHQFPISHDHSDGCSTHDNNQGISKQPSMIEIQYSQDQEQYESPPFQLVVLEEKELKNQKYQIKFKFTNQYRCQVFEIDNSQEDFSEQSIFAFANQKAAELEILDVEEQFAYDLYNLVCENYNQFHSQVSSGQRKAIQEDQQPMLISENNILEIFNRHYLNYMHQSYSYLKQKEIEEYLKVETGYNLKVRQSKEQIQLHRYHLNQQESQIDYESQAQIQMNQKSPQTVQKIVSMNQQPQPQQIQGYGTASNQEQFFDSPEINNLQKKMNNISNASEQHQQNQYQNSQIVNGNIKQGGQTPNPPSNNNTNSTNQNFNQNTSFITPQIPSNNNSNNSNNIGSSIMHFNSNQNTQGNIHSHHLSPNSSVNTFEENQEAQILSNFPPQIQRSGSIQIVSNSTQQNNAQKTVNFFPQNNNSNYQQMGSKTQNMNKIQHAQTTTHQQQQQRQKYQKEVVTNQVVVPREGRSDHKGISHSQSFSNISSQALHKTKSNQSKHQLHNLEGSNQQSMYSSSSIQNQLPQTGKQQPQQYYNTQSNAQQLPPNQQTSNPSFFQQNQQQQQPFQPNVQQGNNQVYTFPHNSNSTTYQQQHQNTQTNYQGRQAVQKSQKFYYASEDSQQAQQFNQNVQISHLKHQSTNQIKQSQSQEQFYNAKLSNLQDDSSNPYQLPQQQQRQGQQQQYQQYPAHPSSFDNETVIRKNSQSNYHASNPPFFIQPLDNKNQFQQIINQQSVQQIQQQSNQSQFIKSLSPPGIQNRRAGDPNSSKNVGSSRPPSSGQQARFQLVLNEKDIQQQTQQQKQQVTMISPTYSQQSQKDGKISFDNFNIPPVAPQQQPQQQQQSQSNNNTPNVGNNGVLQQQQQQIQKVVQQQQQLPLSQQQQLPQQIPEELSIEYQQQLYLRQNQKEFSFNRVTSSSSSSHNLSSPNVPPSLRLQQQFIDQQMINNQTMQGQYPLNKQQQQQQQQQQQITQQVQQNLNQLSSPPLISANQHPTQNIYQIQQNAYANNSPQVQQQQAQQQINQTNQAQQMVVQTQNIAQQSHEIQSPYIYPQSPPPQQSNMFVQVQQQQQQQQQQIPQNQINQNEKHSQQQSFNQQTQQKVVQQVQQTQNNQQMQNQLNNNTQAQPIQQANSQQQQQQQQISQVNQQALQQQHQHQLVNHQPQQQQLQQNQLPQQINQQVNQQIHQQQPNLNNNSQQLNNNNQNFQSQQQQYQQPNNQLIQPNINQTQQQTQIIQQQQQLQQVNTQMNQQQSNQNNSKNSPLKAEEEIKKIILEIKQKFQRSQISKIERVNHDKVKDENEIRLLQRSLKFCSQQQILDNGHFGNYTETMIKLYQKQHNINCNGSIDGDLWKSILTELENQLAQIENKSNLQQQKDQHKKKLIKEIQSQQSKETMSNFESKMFSDFNLTNNDLN